MIHHVHVPEADKGPETVSNAVHGEALSVSSPSGKMLAVPLRIAKLGISSDVATVLKVA